MAVSKAHRQSATKKVLRILKEYACTNFPEICLSRKCAFVYAAQIASSMKKKGGRNEQKRLILARLAAIHSENTQDYAALRGITKYL